MNDRRRSVAAAWDHTHDAQLASAIMSGEAQVRSPKLTVGFSQWSYILMAYRAVGTRGSSE
eukprot:COSAG03_NODE_14779_length_452_cov_1.586402_1_plen_60_part_10